MPKKLLHEEFEKQAADGKTLDLDADGNVVSKEQTEMPVPKLRVLWAAPRKVQDEKGNWVTNKKPFLNDFIRLHFRDGSTYKWNDLVETYNTKTTSHDPQKETRWLQE